jgi:hypothetical protein
VKAAQQAAAADERHRLQFGPRTRSDRFADSSLAAERHGVSPSGFQATMNIAALVLSVWAGSIGVQSATSKPLRVMGSGYDGAIVSGHAQLESDPRQLLEQNEVWTPTEAEVREAEKLLLQFLGSPDAGPTLKGSRIRTDLPRYKRQYWGVTRGGRRAILISFFHEDSSVVREGLWLDGIVSVAGGGDQFFRVTYRLSEKRFDGLRINASY